MFENHTNQMVQQREFNEPLETFGDAFVLMLHRCYKLTSTLLEEDLNPYIFRLDGHDSPVFFPKASEEHTHTPSTILLILR